MVVQSAYAPIALLLLIAVVITVTVYHKQLRAMQGQLQAVTESSTQQLHNDLLKLSIGDSDVLEVWRAEFSNTSTGDFKRHLFVNLHLALLEVAFHLGRLTNDQVLREIQSHSPNSHYRAFWARARAHRQRMLEVEDMKAKTFYDMCEDAFAEKART